MKTNAFQKKSIPSPIVRDSTVLNYKSTKVEGIDAIYKQEVHLCQLTVNITFTITQFIFFVKLIKKNKTIPVLNIVKCSRNKYTPLDNQDLKKIGLFLKTQRFNTGVAILSYCLQGKAYEVIHHLTKVQIGVIILQIIIGI